MKKRDLDCHQDLSFHRWAVSLLTNSTRGKDTHTARECMRAYSNSSRLTATQTSHQEGYRYYLLYHIFLLAQVPSLKGGNFYEKFYVPAGD